MYSVMWKKKKSYYVIMICSPFDSTVAIFVEAWDYVLHEPSVMFHTKDFFLGIVLLLTELAFRNVQNSNSNNMKRVGVGWGGWQSERFVNISAPGHFKAWLGMLKGCASSSAHGTIA